MVRYEPGIQVNDATLCKVCGVDRRHCVVDLYKSAIFPAALYESLSKIHASQEVARAIATNKLVHPQIQVLHTEDTWRIYYGDLHALDRYPNEY